MTVSSDANSDKQTDTGIGCVLTLVAINGLFTGLYALSAAQGPYASTQQEVWYRYGSIGFFLIGAVLPAIAVYLGRRSPAILLMSLTWLILTFLGFVFYAMISSGGV